MSRLRCPRCNVEFELLALNRPTDGSSNETFNRWVSRWYQERRVKRPMDERRTYERWIRHRLGKRAVKSITREDVEDWVVFIDEAVRERKIRAGTAGRIWALLGTMMRDLASSKIRSLRVRADNPASGVRGPDRAAPRASTFLYPSEFLRLVRCRRVPLHFRRLYAVAIYLYPRTGELRALEWDDIDTRTGRVHIHRSEDRHGTTGRTKTQADRQFVCERTILPLLRCMRRRARHAGKVFPHIAQHQNLARVLRDHLRRAGCTRADIYAADDARRPLTFHDLRATGITWQAMRGDPPTTILERVGHAQLSTTERYMRRGRLLAARRERVFPPIPEALLGGR